MNYFATRYQLAPLGKAGRILAMATAHHRFNYIHPFPDGNGRISRLMSHAMAHAASIGAHGLWSISRGLARGHASRTEYKQMMDLADTPRQGDLDGRGNLSQRSLGEYTLWFLQVALDQARFMSELFELDTLSRRLRTCVERSEKLKPGAIGLLQEALIRGEYDRGETTRITGMPERTARRLLNDVTDMRLLASDTPKGPVSLRFPVDALVELGRQLGFAPQSQEKAEFAYKQALVGMESMRKAGVKIGFGTDLLGTTYVQRCREFTIRKEVFKPIEILRQVTSINADILMQKDHLGCIKPGALSPVTHSSAATGFRSVPMPSTQAVMTSPGAR